MALAVWQWKAAPGGPLCVTVSETEERHQKVCSDGAKAKAKAAKLGEPGSGLRQPAGC